MENERRSLQGTAPRDGLPLLTALSHVSLVPATLSPLRTASRRAADPYEICESRVGQLLRLQGEQVELVQQLQAAVTSLDRVEGTTSKSPRRVPPEVGENRENIPPNLHEEWSHMRHSIQPAVEEDAVDLISCATQEKKEVGSSSPSRVVHLLHILQHESSEFAITQCFPAVVRLLSSFEAYWTWKRDHVESKEDDSTSESRLSSSSPKFHSSNTAAGNGAAHSGAASSLRQRYDHVLRVRDELGSFVQLQAEAVRALEPHLQQWMQEKRRHGIQPSSRQFAHYVTELWEVTQTTQHVTRLLQAALQALCRPSLPRTKVGKAEDTQLRRGEGAGDAPARERQEVQSKDGTSGLQRQFDMNAAAEARHTIYSQEVLSKARPASRHRSSSRSPGPAAPSATHGSPASRADASSGVSASTLHTTRRTQAKSSSDDGEERDNTWTGVVSPLTPSPGAGHQQWISPSTTTSASPSPVLSPPPRCSRGVRKESRSGGKGSSASPSVSGVSLSPMTAVRGGDDGDAVEETRQGWRKDVPDASSPSQPPDSVKRSRTPSLSAHLVNAAAVFPPTDSPSSKVSRSSPTNSDAAVSPAPLAGVLKVLTAHRTRGTRPEDGGNRDARSLLPDLASAQANDGSGHQSDVALPVVPRGALTSPASLSRPPAPNTDVSAMVYVPSTDDGRTASSRPPSLRIPIYDVSTQRATSPESTETFAAGSAGRAASIPHFFWPKLSTAATTVTGDAVDGDDEPAEGVEDAVDTQASLQSSHHHHPQTETTADTTGEPFYTSPATLRGVSAEQAESQRTPPEHVEAPSKKAPDAQHPSDTRGRAATPVRIEVDVLERQVEEIRQELRRATRSEEKRRQRRVRTFTRSPPSSASSSSSSSRTGSASKRSSHTVGRRVRPSRSATLERRLERTVHAELEVLRSEQRHSLTSMQREMRATLDEVASAISSSRGSSRHSHLDSGDVHHRVLSSTSRSRSRSSSRPGVKESDPEVRNSDEEAEEAGDDEREVTLHTSEHHANRAASNVEKQSSSLKRSVSRTSPAAASLTASHVTYEQQQPQQRDSSATHPTMHNEEDTIKDALRRTLAETEARAARLEQLTVQLKKRLWLAEQLPRPSVPDSSEKPPSAPRYAELTENTSISGKQGRATTGRGNPHLSLRDAFVYGSSGQREDTGASMDGGDEDAGEPEEKAIVYLVDRMLTQRRKRRGAPVERGGGDDVNKTKPNKLDTVTPPRTSAAAITGESSPTMKFFDDDGITDVSLRRSAMEGWVGAAGRSPQIRRQRASIFERLRRGNSNEQEPAAAASPNTTDRSSAASSHETEWPSPQSQQQQQQKLKQQGLSKLPPPPPLTAVRSDAVHTSRARPPSVSTEAASVAAATPATPLHPYSDVALRFADRMSNEGRYDGSRRLCVTSASSVSHYYDAISGGASHGDRKTGLVVHTGGAPASSLRAEQVLQNARRLLQGRSAAHEQHQQETGGSGLLRDGEGFPPPPPYDAVMSAPHDTCVDSDAVSHGYTERRYDDSSTRQRRQEALEAQTWPDVSAVPRRGRTGYQRGTHEANGLASPRVNGSRYVGYDTSPCAAVAYSSGKVPRAASPSPSHGALRRADRADAQFQVESLGEEQTQSRPLSNEPACSAPPSPAPVFRQHPDTARGTAARYSRVDSATSPLPSPQRPRFSDGGTEKEERPAPPQKQRFDVSSAAQSRFDVSPFSNAGPLSACTRGTASTRRYRSPSYAPPSQPYDGSLHDSVVHREEGEAEDAGDEEDERPRLVLTARRSGAQRHVGWRGHEATDLASADRLPRSRASSLSSQASAHDELLDRLTKQEATLQGALAQLQAQHEMLEEKRSQLRHFTAAKGAAADTAASALQPKGGNVPRGGKHFKIARGAGPSASSPTPPLSDVQQKLPELLDRFERAAEALAVKEQRMRRALTAIQRQKTALLHDDLL